MIKKDKGQRNPEIASSNYQRPHDKWQEVVVQVAGTGDDADVITRKTRSLRWKRWMFTMSVTAFTFGALMIGLGTPSVRNELIAPGDLCSSHAQILAGQGVDRCAACHPAGNQSFSNWISTAALGPSVEMPTQSELCMKCHEQSFGGQWAMHAHNVDPAMLSSLASSDSVSMVGRLGQLASLPAPTHKGKIACSACHREHHGSENDLTMLTDQQCQTCHQTVCHSFETDHPPLDSYPLKRRSSIAFDHASHFSSHFPNAEQPFDCASCHVTDSRNNVQRLVSFEQACANCHQQKIAVLSEPGLTLLALPTLDMPAIEAQGTNIGSWPLAATGDFDGPLPPLMRLLLLADPKANEVLANKDAQFDFSDLDPDQPKDVSDGVTLVWSIKRLMFELARDGRPAIARRVKEATGVALDATTLKELTDALEILAFQNSANRWLPDLKAEVGDQVPTYAATQQVRDSLAELAAQPPREFEWSDQTVAALAKAVRTTARKTVQQDADLQDQPRRDNSQWLAVNPLAGAASPLPSSATNLPSDGEARDVQPSEIDPPQSETRVAPEPASNAEPDGFVAQQGGRENSEWLAKNPLSTKTEALVVESPLAGQDKGQSSSKQPDSTSQAPTNVAAKQPRRVTIWARGDAPVVGWVRDDLRFQLRYQPTGHSDTTLKSWIDLAGQLDATKSESKTNGLFELLLANESFGDCRRCHTADRRVDGQLAINWEPKYRDPAVASFTRFSHGPHLILPQLRDCSQCHQLDPAQGNKESFIGFDSQQFQSNFVALTTSDCASCHRAGSASNSCTQCHNYHVGMRVEE